MNSYFLQVLKQREREGEEEGEGERESGRESLRAGAENSPSVSLRVVEGD